VKLILAATLLGASLSSVYAADLELVPGRVTRDGYYKQVFTLRDHTNDRLESIQAKCGIFNRAGELIATGVLLFTDVPPNAEAYDETGTDQMDATNMKCRITK
jgi:hypothetical protein